MTAEERVARRARAATRQYPEYEIHVEVVRRLRAAGVDFFHCPNESDVPPQYRAKLARLGVSPGVPDLVIVTPPPRGGFVGAAIEIKAPGGRLSKAQRAWLERYRAAGHAAFEAGSTGGLDEVLELLRWLGYAV